MADALNTVVLIATSSLTLTLYKGSLKAGMLSFSSTTEILTLTEVALRDRLISLATTSSKYEDTVS